VCHLAAGGHWIAMRELAVVESEPRQIERMGNEPRHYMPVGAGRQALSFKRRSPRAGTKIYDRTSDEITLDEVERIAI
jgi:hypothetical protein